MAIFRRPPRDGWLLVEPGKSILLRTPEPKLQALEKSIHTLRGSILSDAYNVENILDSALTLYFFGSVDAEKNEKVEIFQEELLRNNLSFDKKIKLFKSLLKGALSVFEDAKKFHDNMDALRQIRNMFAHYPTWIEVVPTDDEDKAIEEFKAYIAKDENKIFELTNDQIRTWIKLINETVQTGEATVRFLEHLLTVK